MKKLRGIWGIIIAVLVVFSVIFGALIFSADASSGPASTGLNQLSGYGIANETSAVWGLNATGHTAHWYSLSFTVDKTTNSISITQTPAKEKISLIIIQTKNLSQSVYDLLQNGALFTYATFSLTGTNTNLTDAYMYFGSPVNATSDNARADKGITNYVMNQTLFDAQQSNFNTPVQLDMITYLASDFHTSAQYAFFVNQSKNGTGVYTSFSISFTQYFEYTTGQQYPLVTYIASFGLAILVLAMFVTYLAAPEYEGGEEDRAKAFQTKKEIGVAVAGLAGILAVLVIEGFVGNITPQGGWGAAIASLFLFGLFTYAYTEIPQRQRYGRTIGIGLLGVVIGFILNMFLPFGTITYNFMTSSNIIALVYGWLAAIFFIVIAYYGLIDTKRYKLRRREHTHKAKELKA